MRVRPFILGPASEVRHGHWMKAVCRLSGYSGFLVLPIKEGRTRTNLLLIGDVFRRRGVNVAILDTPPLQLRISSVDYSEHRV